MLGHFLQIVMNDCYIFLFLWPMSWPIYGLVSLNLFVLVLTWSVSCLVSGVVKSNIYFYLCSPFFGFS